MTYIKPIDQSKPIDFNTIYNVLSSSKITDNQKIQFMKNNSTEINRVVELAISSKDYKVLMANRPLIKYRPIKNSITKRGDKKLLAMALNIYTPDVDQYLKELTLNLEDKEIIDSIPSDKIEAARTYIYRHGKKEQVIKFLDDELSHTKNILKLLYKTLEYNTDGIADYFMRPIHRLDNNTMYRIYNVIDKNLKTAQQNGIITDQQYTDNAKWALLQIYRLQNNQRLIKATKIYESIK